jgi:hypothetical protein
VTWFVASACLLAVALLGFHAWRADARWHGTLRVDGCEAQLGGFLDERFSTIVVGRTTRAGIEFEIRRQDGFDRLALWAGVATKRTIGIASFDRDYFLVADDPYVLAGLRFDPELPPLIAQLLEPPYGLYIHSVDRLACRSNWVRVPVKADVGFTGAATVVQRIALTLVPLAEHLDAAGAEERPDPAARRARWLLSLADALLLHGLVLGFAVIFDGSTMTLAVPGNLALAQAIGWSVGAALTLATGWLLWRTSRVHRVLVYVAVVGTVGAQFSALVWVHAGLG